jgi:hypothetical protein
MCNNEFDIFGTTQGYDGASGKKITDLALEQCGVGCVDGSPAYWEKHAELKQAALDDCITACQCAEGMAWDTENSPETIVAGSSVQVFVTGGRGPYTWSVSGNGYSLLVSETVTGINQVTCAEGDCGTDYDASVSISVIDACGNTASGTLKNAEGEWVLINSCGTLVSQEGHITYIEGIYKYIEDHCCSDIPANCSHPECGSCYGTGGSSACDGAEANQGCDGYETYEWSCQ